MKSVIFGALFLIGASTVFAVDYTKECPISIDALSIGNLQSPNDLFVIEKSTGTWYDLGFYDNSWTKGYFSVASIAMTMGQRVMVGYKSTTVNITTWTCPSLYQSKDWVMYVKTLR